MRLIYVHCVTLSAIASHNQVVHFSNSSGTSGICRHWIQVTRYPLVLESYYQRYRVFTNNMVVPILVSLNTGTFWIQCVWQMSTKVLICLQFSKSPSVTWTKSPIHRPQHCCSALHCHTVNHTHSLWYKLQTAVSLLAPKLDLQMKSVGDVIQDISWTW